MVALFVLVVAIGVGILGAFLVVRGKAMLAALRHRHSLEGQVERQQETVRRLEEYISSLQRTIKSPRTSETTRVNHITYREVSEKKLEIERTKLKGLEAERERREFEERMRLN